MQVSGRVPVQSLIAARARLSSPRQPLYGFPSETELMAQFEPYGKVTQCVPSRFTNVGKITIVGSPNAHLASFLPSARVRQRTPLQAFGFVHFSSKTEGELHFFQGRLSRERNSKTDSLVLSDSGERDPSAARFPSSCLQIKGDDRRGAVRAVRKVSERRWSDREGREQCNAEEIGRGGWCGGRLC